jgi:transcriptional regulator with XRE-family HTH domain
VSASVRDVRVSPMSAELGAWLREQRQAHGWPVPEMARQLRQSAEASGDALPGSNGLQRNIRRWESGQGTVSERYKLHYCSVLGIPPAQFGPGHPAGQPHEAADAASQAPGTVGGIAPRPDGRPATAPAASPAAPERDGRGGSRWHEPGDDDWPLEPGPWRERLIAVMAAESQEFGEWVGMSEVADTTIERYSQQVGQLARDFEHATPFPLLLETRRLRDRVVLGLRGHQRPDQAKELYLIGAQVCGLLAWMTGDLGNYRAADTHAWTAWMCAEQAGHNGARAWVRGTQAKLAYWDGRYSESAQLAEDGLGYDCADTARSFLALCRARALARAGLPEDAGRALGQAETEHGRVSAPDLLGGVWSLTPGRYHGMAASTRLLLDDPAKALAESSEAVAFCEADPPAQRHLYTELLARVDQVHAHLQEPDLDGASAALRPVLGLHPDSRIDPVIQRLTSLRNALAAPAFASTRQARELQQEIEAYSGDAITRALSA